jgi:hypothetical protein
MISDTRVQIGPVAVSTSAATVYYSVPYRCVLRNVRQIPQAKMTSVASNAVTVTASISSTSTALGVAACAVDSSSDAAIGVAGVYTPNASTGSTVLAAGQVVKFVASATDASFLLDVELDPHARSL